MTAKELLANLRSTAGTIDPAECFLYMAAHAHELRLDDGQRLNDLVDFTSWLLLVAHELNPRTNLMRRAEADRTRDAATPTKAIASVAPGWAREDSAGANWRSRRECSS